MLYAKKLQIYVPIILSYTVHILAGKNAGKYFLNMKIKLMRP